MRTRPTFLWPLCLLALAGCDSLLSDLSGTLCNADGSCTEGYHCSTQTNRCERGPGPTPQDPGDGGDTGDGGSSQDGGADAGVCAGILACASGDGCCPTGCHANNDSDCRPLCGNGHTEASGGEVCDDGNLLNGDNCDPTCRYFNVMSTLSGVPGSRSFADGLRDVARFHGPAGITSDGQRIFITDANNSTIRQYRFGTTTTLAGTSYWKQSVDGPGRDAGFVSPGDVAYLGGALYIVDAPGTVGATLRRLELDGGVVSTVDAGSPFASLRGVGTAGSALLLVDNNGLSRWDPGTGLRQLVAPANQLSPVAGAPCVDVSTHPLEPDDYYLACTRSIVRVMGADGGGVALFAGSAASTGCADSDGGPLTNARFTGARSLDWALVSGVPRLYVADSACHTLQYLAFGQASTIAGAAASPGYVDVTAPGDPRDARFNAPYGVEVPDTSGATATVHVTDFDNAAYRYVTALSTGTNAGSPPATSLTYGDGGTSSRYTQVTMLAVDGEAGVLYAYAPVPRRLFQVSLATGTPEELMAFGSSPQPLGLTVLQGTLYVSLNNKTVARLKRGPPATLEHLTGQAGSSSPSADGDLTTAILFASDLATDGEDLFFHDLSAKTVRKIDLQSQLVTTLAGGASTLPDGGAQPLIDGVGRNARFANPLDLASDGKSLYLLDGLSFSAPRSVVRKVDIATGEVTTLAGDLNSPWSARDGVGPAARLAGAIRLTTDGRVLFISDPGGGYGLPDLTSPAIRMLDLQTREVTTVVGTRGQWTLKNGTGTGAAINAPGPIVFDPVRKWIIFFDYEEGVFQRIR